MLSQEQVHEAVWNGRPIECSREDWPVVRPMLVEVHRKMMEWDQGVRVTIAKQELVRLDATFAREEAERAALKRAAREEPWDVEGYAKN